MDRDELIELTDIMDVQGGSFAKSLAQTMLLADSRNLQILLNSFESFLEPYIAQLKSSFQYQVGEAVKTLEMPSPHWLNKEYASWNGISIHPKYRWKYQTIQGSLRFSHETIFDACKYVKSVLEKQKETK